MFSFRGPKLKYCAGVLAQGVYDLFQSRSIVKTPACMIDVRLYSSSESSVSSF